MAFAPEQKPWREDIRFVGKGSPEAKAEYHRALAETFHGKKPSLLSEHDWEAIKLAEKEKTPQERAAIRIANLLTNETRQKYDLEPLEVSEQNFLILSDNAYVKPAGGIEDEEFEVATSDTEHQRVYMREKVVRLFPVHAAQTILHEMAHHKGVLSFEVSTEAVMQEEQLKKAIPRREGLTAYIHSSKIRPGEKEPAYLIGLDEAIIENYVMRRTPRLLAAPEFAREQEWRSSEEAEALKEEIAKRENMPVSEIAWVTRDGEWQPHSYRPQRAVMRYCAEEIARDFPEEFPGAEDVIDRFEESAFVSKRMLSMGRFVERTFGRGAFRILAEMNDEPMGEGGNAETIMEQLRKMREERLDQHSRP